MSGSLFELLCAMMALHWYLPPQLSQLDADNWYLLNVNMVSLVNEQSCQL